MDPIGDAIKLLGEDAADTAAKSRAKDDRDAEAAAAAHAAAVAASDKQAAIDKQNADLDATVRLLEQTYRVN